MIYCLNNPVKSRRITYKFHVNLIKKSNVTDKIFDNTSYNVIHVAVDQIHWT